MTRVIDIASDKNKQNWYAYEYERPSFTVDGVCLYEPEDDELEVLLIKRGGEPYKNHFALPGGFMEINETVKEAMKRELLEETGVVATNVVPLKLYDDVYRDTRSRVLSQAFVIPFLQKPVAVAGSDAAETKWFKVSEAKKLVLAFDHNKMLKDAVEVYIKEYMR